MRIFPLIIFCLLVIACNPVPAEIREAASTAAGLVQAEEAIINIRVSASTGSGTEKTLALFLKNPAVLDTNRTKEDVSAVAALGLYWALPEEQRSNYDVIAIDLQIQGVSSSTRFPVSDLKIANRAMNDIGEVMTNLSNGAPLSDWKSYFDSKYIADSNLVMVSNFFASAVEQAGTLEGGKVTEFKFDSNPDLEMSWVDIQYRMDFAKGAVNSEFTIDKKTGKIISLEIY